MRLLLDTHALAWWFLDTPQLPTRIRDYIIDPDNLIVVSAVSAFEASTKFRIGKWDDAGPLATAFEETMISLGYPVLDVTARHATRAGLLPGEHRDPFDRLLAAQALVEDFVMVTNDGAIKELGAEIIW